MRYLLLLSLIFCLHSLSAQKKLLIETDKAFYSSGEKMGIVVSGNSGGAEEIVHLELLDRNGQVLQRQSSRSTGLIASTIFDIPLDWKSNWYLLRAYTIWVPSMEIKDLGMRSLPIYSEFDKNPANTEESMAENDKPGSEFQIFSDKASYQIGEKVEIRLPNATKENTDWVIRVMDQETFDKFSKIRQLSPTPEIKLSPRKAEIGEAQKKLVFVGKIGEYNTNGLAAMYIAEKLDFSWLSVGDGQLFGLSLEDFEGDMQAQVLSIEAFGGVEFPEVSMVYASDNIHSLRLNLPPLPYTPAIVSYLAEARKRRIIADVFAQKLELDLEEDKEKSEALSFVKPDKSYSPQEYIRFNDTRDFINEVATFMRIKNDDNGESFQVMMERNTLAEHPPAMFLNGYMFTDAKELLEMELDDIERIDIYRKERTILKQFKTLGRNGVIAVFTKNPSKKPRSGSKLKLQGFQENGSKIEIKYHQEGPTFSPRLLWDAAPTINEDGELSCSFSLSDDPHNFIIIIDKYTDGKKLQSHKIIEVVGPKP